MPDLSVVIPTLNEAGNVAKLIPRVEDEFRALGVSGEVVVVDDSSTDGTREAAEAAGRQYGNVKVVVRGVRDGLGNALRRGVTESSGEFIVFMDADLSHDPKELGALLAALNSNDVVVGSRFIEGARMQRTLSRRLISGAYNHVARLLLSVGVADVTSGYRGFRKSAFTALAISSAGPEIHSELVVKACVAGLRVAEVPVAYRDRLEGESKLNYAAIGPGYARVLVLALYAKAANLFKRNG